MVNWDRNVFAGIERAPAVTAGQLLVLTEAHPAAVARTEVDFSWLEVVGLDRTVARRGLAVVEEMRGRYLAGDAQGLIRAYRPTMPLRVAVRA